MGDGIAGASEWTAARSHRLERAVVMHATSELREAGARLLADLVRETGAHGAAYGWTDDLGPGRLAPVHAVAVVPEVCWDAALPNGVARLIERAGSRRWHLMVRGADPERLRAAADLVARAVGWYAESGERARPHVHEAAAAGAAARLIALLDAYREVGFEIGLRSELPHYRAEVTAELACLPAAARPAAHEVAEALGRPGRLGPALLRLGAALDASGALAEAASVHVIGHQLALLRADARGGIDAARSAGRAYRRLTEWAEAFRWYGLARRIAETEGDRSRLALVLDGEGHTHRARGAFPAARARYRRAWGLALASQEPSLVAAVGHSMLTAERTAGRFTSAARYAWVALSAQDDSAARANLLLNIGTLLREAGDLDAAVDAFVLARTSSPEPEIRMMAADALAYCAALRGGDGYERWRRVAMVEARGTPSYLRAQVGYFRGASLQAMGRPGAARRVLGAVERFAKAAGLHEWEIKAAELAATPLPQPVPAKAPLELRKGLRELREAAAV